MKPMMYALLAAAAAVALVLGGGTMVSRHDQKGIAAVHSPGK